MEAGANGLSGLLALSHAVVVFIKREPDNVTTHTKLMEDNLVLHQVARAENVEQPLVEVDAAAVVVLAEDAPEELKRRSAVKEEEDEHASEEPAEDANECRILVLTGVTVVFTSNWF